MVKNIAIMDSVYDLLVRNKRANESFSQELLRIIEKKDSIMKFAGAWKIPEKDVAKMKKVITKLKQETTDRILHKVRP